MKKNRHNIIGRLYDTGLPGFITLLTLAFTACTSSTTKEPVDYVDPYIGTISHLLMPTYPTVQLPNSMLRVFPNRHDVTEEYVSGLPLIVTAHRSQGAFTLSPTLGEARRVVRSTWDAEHCTPYSYTVSLADHTIDVDFAVSNQSALYGIKKEGDDALSLILTSHGGIMHVDGRTASGWEPLDTPADKVYIYMEVDTDPETASSLDAPFIRDEWKETAIVWKFAPDVKAVQARYGISFISEEQARANLQREQQGFDRDALLKAGRKAWNEALSTLDIEGGTDDERAVFYTSYYRTFERPVCLSEDGHYYSAYDHAVHDDEGTPFYTDDWIWDTYRAAHPLRTLLNAPLEENILASYLRMAEQNGNGWMPTFPGISGDSHCMNSNHAVISVADALAKGLHVDYAKAYNACSRAIDEKTLAPWRDVRRGRIDDFYDAHGYIPALREDEEETDPVVHDWERRQPIAVTLGTAYDQWALSVLADTLGMADEAQRLRQCSYNYRNLYNPATAFFHPKDSTGQFIEPFDYRFSGGMGARQYYDENNGWTYRWDVPHRVDDLIQLMGGAETFVRNLDATFSEPMGRSKYDFYALLPDQTGNVGQFTMANEPSMHIPYLYNYAGAPWKTQQRIRQLLYLWFRNDLMGVPGDEDGGGMTSFVVFSSIGLYPVTPGVPVYNIGSPLFTKTVLTLSAPTDSKVAKTFTILAPNASTDAKYIRSATLNGQPLDRPWITHEEIMQGGMLSLDMDTRPNPAWGANCPPPCAPTALPIRN